MKKILCTLLSITLIAACLTGCSLHSKDQEIVIESNTDSNITDNTSTTIKATTKQKQKITSNSSTDWKDFLIILNDQEIKLPVTLTELYEKTGYAITRDKTKTENEYKNTTKGKGYLVTNVIFDNVNNDADSIVVDYCNPESGSVATGECVVYRINAAIEKTKNPCTSSFIIANNLKLGDTWNKDTYIEEFGATDKDATQQPDMKMSVLDSCFSEEMSDGYIGTLNYTEDGEDDYGIDTMPDGVQVRNGYFAISFCHGRCTAIDISCSLSNISDGDYSSYLR